MKKMEFLKSETIEHALAQHYRQYLTGKLKHPQPELQHMEDEIEIGLSHYKEFTPDLPHVHPVATEHCYVVKGSVRCRLLDGSGQAQQFDEGDFFVFRPNEPHACKNAPGTVVLFIKSPAINDKTLVDVDEETGKWLLAWD